MISRREYALPDGSTVVVETEGTRTGVERWVGDRQVWVTVLDHTWAAERDVEVAALLGRMRECPAEFDHSQAWARAAASA